jgi:hypothetical protein
MLDSSDSAAGVNAWIRTGSTVADGESALITFTSAIGALSDCAIVARHLVYRGVEDPRPAAPGLAPAAGAGVFIFSCADVDTYAIVFIPSFRSDLLLTSGPGAGILIDQESSDVLAFTDVMISDIFCNPFGVQVTALESAYYQWRP